MKCIRMCFLLRRLTLFLTIGITIMMKVGLNVNALVVCTLLFHWQQLPYLVSSQTSTSAMSPSISVEIFPSNSEIQRENDTVSLLCRVVNLFDMDRYLVSWYTEPTSEDSQHTLSRDQTVSGRYMASFVREGSSTYVLNLTIDSVDQRDDRTFKCNLFEVLGNEMFAPPAVISVHLSVFPVDAFPTCEPTGQSSVHVGSELACQTNGGAVPAIAGNVGNWTLFTQDGGHGALLLKNANSSDNEKTYVCTAELPNSRMNLSCHIGPLTIVAATTEALTPVVTGNTATTAAPDAGFPQEAIIGVTVGATVLLIVIVVCVLCCLCNSRKRKNICTCSVKEENDSVRGTLEAVNDGYMSSDRIEVPPSYNSENGDTPRPASGAQPNIYAESKVAVPNPDLNIDLRLQLNVTVTQEKQAENPPKVRKFGNSNRASGPPPQTEKPRLSRPQDDTEPTAGSADAPAESPPIYAQANKQRYSKKDEATPTPEDLPSPNSSEKPSLKPKPENIKTFVETKKEMEHNEDDGGAGSIVYADLDLKEAKGSCEIQAAEEEPTVYAELKLE